MEDPVFDQICTGGRREGGRLKVFWNVRTFVHSGFISDKKMGRGGWQLAPQATTLDPLVD